MPRITIYTPSDIDTIPADALKKLAMKTLIYEEKERVRSKLYYSRHQEACRERNNRKYRERCEKAKPPGAESLTQILAPQE
jgi:ribosomal protein S30